MPYGKKNKKQQQIIYIDTSLNQFHSGVTKLASQASSIELCVLAICKFGTMREDNSISRQFQTCERIWGAQNAKKKKGFSTDKKTK